MIKQNEQEHNKMNTIQDTEFTLVDDDSESIQFKNMNNSVNN